MSVILLQACGSTQGQVAEKKPPPLPSVQLPSPLVMPNIEVREQDKEQVKPDDAEKWQPRLPPKGWYLCRFEDEESQSI